MRDTASLQWPPVMSLQHSTTYPLAPFTIKGFIARPVTERRRQTTQIKHMARGEYITSELVRSGASSHRMKQEQRWQGPPGLMVPGGRLLR